MTAPCRTVRHVARAGALLALLPIVACSQSAPTAPETASMTAPPPATPAVFVNGQRIDEATLAALAQHYRMRIAPGRYWYDRISGAAGPEGGPTLAFIMPGLELGGPLQSNASNGNTGVFVNGRELPAWDLAGLTRLVGYIVPGRYFLDAMGNAGIEGGPPTVNLIAASRQAATAGGGDGWYSNNTQAGGNSSGGAGYVMGTDASGKSWGAAYGF